MKIIQIVQSLVIGILSVSSTWAQQASFDHLTKHLSESVVSGKVAGGSILIWKQGEIVFQTGFGYADVESKTPFEVSTPVVIASISKPIVGTTLFRLAELGKLEPQAPLTRYLPEFENRGLESGEPLTRPPTIVELLTHTSGLRGDYDKLGRIWFQSWTEGQSLEFVVNKVASDFPFKRDPGIKHAYSGIGTDIAARVGEVVSGESRNNMLLTYFSKPLDMDSTFYRNAEALVELEGLMPTRYNLDSETGQIKIRKVTDPPKDNQYNSSGGSIISTAPDLLNWLLMIRNGGEHNGNSYLTKASIKAMLSPTKVSRTGAGGLYIREKDEAGKAIVYGHSGSSGTNCWINLKHDYIAIVLTQTAFNKGFDFDLQGKISEILNLND